MHPSRWIKNKGSQAWRGLSDRKRRQNVPKIRQNSVVFWARSVAFAIGLAPLCYLQSGERQKHFMNLKHELGYSETKNYFALYKCNTIKTIKHATEYSNIQPYKQILVVLWINKAGVPPIFILSESRPELKWCHKHVQKSSGSCTRATLVLQAPRVAVLEKNHLPGVRRTS